MLTKAMKDEDDSKDAIIGRLLDSQIDITEDDTAADDYGREEAIDQIINQSWEGTPEPNRGDPMDGDPMEE